jgi:hypothetical protein
VLLALGLALVAVGAALVATPLALRATGAAAPPPDAAASPAGSGLNEEGVPLDALPAAQQDGEMPDCQVALVNRSTYLDAAAAAEASLLGVAAADLPPDQLRGAVQRLPPLLLGTVFWVLVSDSRPWTPQFPAAAAAQVGSLSSARAAPGSQVSGPLCCSLCSLRRPRMLAPHRRRRAARRWRR